MGVGAHARGFSRLGSIVLVGGVGAFACPGGILLISVAVDAGLHASGAFLSLWAWVSHLGRIVCVWGRRVSRPGSILFSLWTWVFAPSGALSSMWTRAFKSRKHSCRSGHGVFMPWEPFLPLWTWAFTPREYFNCAGRKFSRLGSTAFFAGGVGCPALGAPGGLGGRYTQAPFQPRRPNMSFGSVGLIRIHVGSARVFGCS